MMHYYGTLCNPLYDLPESSIPSFDVIQLPEGNTVATQLSWEQALEMLEKDPSGLAIRCLTEGNQPRVVWDGAKEFAEGVLP